jgi:alcohol dehydrogenase
MGAQAAGARQIIGADINPAKRKKALELGAHQVIDSSLPDALEELREMTQGGVDISVEFAGVIPALDFAFQASRRGGTTVTAALPHPNARLSISPTLMVGMEKSLKGSYLGSCVAQRDIPNYLDLYRTNRLQIDKLITHRISLEDINEGFERLAEGEAIRQVVIFNK